MSDFSNKATSALTHNKGWLSKEVIPRLKRTITLYNDKYQRFYEILIKEKLVREDAYKSDRSAKKLEVPASEAVSEDIKSSEMALRLSMLSSQFIYLSKSLDLTVDGCNISFLKNLLGILQYIKWEDQLRNENEFMTNTIGTLIRQIPANSPVSVSLQGLCQDLEKLTNDAMICLSHLIVYAKEHYKNFVTTSYIKNMTLDTASTSSFDKAVDAFLVDLQRRMKVAKLVPFYHDLCSEAVKDNYASDADNRQERIIGELFKEKPIALSFEKEEIKLVKDSKMSAMDLKRILIEALVESGKCSIMLDLIVKKLVYNQRAYHANCTTFWQKVLLFLKNLIAKGEIYYNISYPNVSTGLSISEKVGFAAFVSKSKELISKLHVYSNSELIDISGLEQVDDEKLLQTIIRTTIDIKIIAIKSEALNKKFKDDIATHLLSKFKGMTNDFKNINYGVRRIQDFVANYSNEKMKLDLEDKLDEYISNQDK